MAGLLNFTPAAYTQLSAVAFPQIAALPASGSPTQLISNIGGATAIVLLCVAAATTTATAAVGAKTITVASATSIAVGQLVVGAGVPAGTVVNSVASTVIGISNALTAALSTTAVNFYPSVSPSTGIAILPNQFLALGTGSNDHIAYVSQAGQYGSAYGACQPAILNVASGT